jgi:hypothetical protein
MGRTVASAPADVEFLSQPQPPSATPLSVAEARRILSLIGQTLAQYRVAAALGAGGMGEVYRATDAKLGREVALKLLPEAFASDPERLARFEREARLLASLNHPNIAHLYGFENASLDGETSVHFIAMELVEGEDLAERLKRGAIPVDEAVAIAKQVAEALEEAHEKGIVHRDLKPGNVKVTPEGKVKVLDFGLAKAWTGEGSGTAPPADFSRSPTLAHTGTAARLFDGETVTDVLASVVKEPILLRQMDPKTVNDVWSLRVGPQGEGQEPSPFLRTDANEVAAVFSPDGRWVAYASDESGRYEVYVRAFPSGAGRQQLSSGGGISPLWRADGGELCFQAPDGMLMATAVELRARPDGQRFLVSTTVDTEPGAPLTVVLDWTALVALASGAGGAGNRP